MELRRPVVTVLAAGMLVLPIAACDLEEPPEELIPENGLQEDDEDA